MNYLLLGIIVTFMYDSYLLGFIWCFHPCIAKEELQYLQFPPCHFPHIRFIVFFFSTRGIILGSRIVFVCLICPFWLVHCFNLWLEFPQIKHTVCMSQIRVSQKHTSPTNKRTKQISLLILPQHIRLIQVVQHIHWHSNFLRLLKKWKMLTILHSPNTDTVTLSLRISKGLWWPFQYACNFWKFKRTNLSDSHIMYPIWIYLFLLRTYSMQWMNQLILSSVSWIVGGQRFIPCRS